MLTKELEIQRILSGYLLSLLVTVLVLAVASCSYFPTTPATPTPYVIITAMLAETRGKLIQGDGCLRVVHNDQYPGYGLIFPSDFIVTIDNRRVQIVSGIVSGKREEMIVELGQEVILGGGGYVDEKLKKTIPANCQEPYWVVGGIISFNKLTQEP
jgi:hypothetical protein